MKFVFIMLSCLGMWACQTCEPVELISSQIAGAIGQTFSCSSELVLEDIEPEVNALDLCGSFDQLQYIKNTPGGIQTGESTVCYTVIKKIQPSKSWQCKKPLDPKPLEEMCSKFSEEKK